MTPKERAAMQQALEALEALNDEGGLRHTEEAAITALREALAEQAEQEPVGYFAYDEEHDIWEELTGPNASGATKLYAAPLAKQDTHATHVVRTKDLTDDEIDRALDAANVPELPAGYESVELEIARAVIAADREKNK